MPRFNKYRIKELQEMLYYSHIHDAKLESVRYEQSEKVLEYKHFMMLRFRL